MTDNIILPEEYDLFVDGVQTFQIVDIGSDRWIEFHENLLKLNQQAILEASTFREEMVKEMLIINGKLPILVHEAFCILVWRIKVLPKILAINPNPNATFMLYTVMYHEATVISLLEVVLYHENGCVSLDETAIDLVDYCAQAITHLIGLVNVGHFRDEITPNCHVNAGEELERQKRDLLYGIGLRCLTILSYLADKVNVLPLSVARRMVQTHDVPCLLSEILHCQPWQRNVTQPEKFINEKWQSVSRGDILKVTKNEAQTWFCFRQLLLNRNVMQHYEINEFRQRELAKCQALLTVHILDQLPALVDLKHYLCRLSVTGNSGNGRGVFLEEMPQIRENLIFEANRIGFKSIAKQQYDKYLDLDQNDIMKMAKRLSEAYNTDFLMRMETSETIDSEHKRCGKCKAIAIKKCSKCEQVYYCTRECQIKHWPIHKEVCHAQD